MRARAGVAIGVAAACALACAAGCTSGGARPLAPVAPARPTASSRVESRVDLSPKTGQPIRHSRALSVGVDHGRAWRVRPHALEIFDVRTLRTTRIALPGLVSGRRVAAVDVGPNGVVVATTGIRHIEVYSRPLSRQGRWHATDLRVRGRIDQAETPAVDLSVAKGVVAVLADYVGGMTVAQNFLFLSYDAGRTFRRATSPPGLRTTEVSFTDRTTGFVVEGSIGVPAFLAHTEDGGRSWHLAKVPGTRLPGHRVGFGRPSSGPGSSVVVPVQHGDSRSRVRMDVSTDGGRTFRPTPRTFVFSGPAHGGLPSDIGPAGPDRAVAIGGWGLVATIDGNTWHGLAWFHPQRHRLRHGKYAADLLGTPGGRHVFVQVSGYPNDDHSNRPEPWTFLDRSADRGRTWHASPARHGPERLAAMHAVWTDRRNGWAYGPDLFETTNGGRTWHRELLGHVVLAASVAHGRLVAVAQRCTDSTLSCPDRKNEVFTAAIGHAPQPVSSQALPAADVMTVYHTSSRSIDTIVARYRKHTRPRFDVEQTTHAQTTSRRLRVPAGCAASLLRPEFDYVDGTLWLACQTSNGTPTPQWGPVLIYQSRDDGRTWVRTSGAKRNDLRALGWLVPVDGRTAWAVTDGSIETGGSLLWHTRDEGRTWRRVRGVPRGGTIDALTTPTATSAEATVRVIRHNYATIRLLHITRNGRHAWLSPLLPVPDNLPR